jgi:hypothetical protein
MSFDVPSDFLDKLREAALEHASEGLNAMGRDIQVICDDVFDNRGGKVESELYDELKTRLTAREFNLPEEHLKAYAAAIAAGQRVKIEPSIDQT